MSGPSLYRFIHHAMASEFSLHLAGTEKEYARRAAQAAFREIDRVEAALSRFRHDSDIARLNRLRVGEMLRPTLHGMECLALARRVWIETDGAFDPAVGALLAWRASEPNDSVPPVDVLARAGMDKLLATESHHQLGVAIEGLRVDLGAIGKGYGVDRAAHLLREDWGIGDALVQGGESSMRAWGCMAGESPWPLAVRDPRDPGRVLAEHDLVEGAASGSGQLLHGSHIIDPRTGIPVRGGHAAWTCAPTAAEADALSTALMVMTPEEATAFFRRRSDVGGLLIDESGHLLELGCWGTRHVLHRRSP